MLDSLKQELVALGWKEVEDGPASGVVSFEVLVVGYESNDDGRFPEYNLNIYDNYHSFESERNTALKDLVDDVLSRVYSTAGNRDVEVEIDDKFATLSFINLRDRH